MRVAELIETLMKVRDQNANVVIPGVESILSKIGRIVEDKRRKLVFLDPFEYPEKENDRPLIP